MEAVNMVAVTLIVSLLLCKATRPQNLHEKRSDDTPVSSLEAVVHQLTAQVQTLLADQEKQQNRLTALESEQNRLTALESKNAALREDVASLKTRVAALSETVAFTVRFRVDNETHGIATDLHAPLRFDDVDFNAGNRYDPQTGIFSAPVAGTYAFFLTQMGTSNLGDIYLVIDKHDIVLDVVYSKDHEDQGSSQVTTHLAAGQQVWVRQEGGTGVRGVWYTVFTGYLLQAD